MADSDASQGSAALPKTKKQSRFSKFKALLKPSTPSPSVPVLSSTPNRIGASGNRPSVHGGDAAPPLSSVPPHDVAEATINQNLTDTKEPTLSTTIASVAEVPITSSPQYVPDPAVQHTPEPCSIKDLWDTAYEELKLKDKKLIDDYEHIIRGDMSAMLGATATFGSKVQRKDLMQNLLTRKIQEVKDNAWKLKYGGHEIAVKDLAKPVTEIISWADDYISGALAANPYASIAWAGVSLLLPLTLNPSKQAASLAKSLDYISDLIVRSTMRELLFGRRYGPKQDEESPKLDLSTAKSYADTLKSLYIEILKFQATTIRYMDKNGLLRLGMDMVKWNDWDGSLSGIQEQETAFCGVYEIWKDVRHEEDCEKVYQQHREKLEALGTISYNIVALQKSIELRQEESSRNELLDWLSSVDPSENYNVALQKRRDGTGEWLLQESSDFEDWRTGRSSLLWLNGKAGSGKSILSASVIEKLRDIHSSDPETSLAYFYFSFNDGKKQDVVEMLSSIIKQLCCRRPDTPAAVEALRQYKTSGQRPDQKTLEKTLKAVIFGFTHVHIVIDALDECPSGLARIDLLNTIGRVIETKMENLHLLLTSRRETDIEAALVPTIKNTSSGCFTSDINLSTIQSAVEKDIAFYIDREFGAEPFCSWPADVKAEAKSALIQNSDGMFQYVSCQFDDLRQHKAKKKIQEALRNLPNGLDATYNRMLNNIAPEYQQGVASVLKWLAFSLRPLLVDELAEAFILDPEKPFEEEERLFKPEDVLNYLAGFVVKVPTETGYYDHSEQSRFAEHTNVFQIRFAHFSIKEYLCSTRISLKYFSTAEELSHLYLAKSCLVYHLQLSETTLATKDTINRYALWDYAARNWSRHLEMIDRQAWTDYLVVKATALSADSQSLLNMVRISDPEIHGRAYWETTVELLPLPLYYTSGHGLSKLTQFLIDGGVDVNGTSTAGKYGTALQVAAYWGHQDVVSILLENHANIDQISGRYGSALQTAAFRGGERIVKLLIDHRAEINAQGGEYGNALQAAASRGDLEIMQLLIDHGAEINAQGGEYGNVLQAAAWGGNEEIIQLLIDHGAEINAQGGTYGNALQAAARRGSKGTVQLLIDHGAEINAQGGEYGNALQAAAWRGIKEIIQLLIDHGAEINAQGGLFGNALQAAIVGDEVEVAEHLLSLGAEVDEPGEAWEELLLRIEKEYDGLVKVKRLREFQQDPKGYIARRKEEIEREEAEMEEAAEEAAEEAVYLMYT